LLDRLQAEMQCALEGQTQTTSRAGGTDLMKLCLENGVHQVDLNRSQKRVTNEEYRAKQHGQEVLDKQNDVLKKHGQEPKETNFETEKEKIRKAILEAISVRHSPEEFQKNLQEQYGIQVKESRGRWSHLPSNRKQPVTGRKLGDAFEKTAVLAAISGQNQEKSSEYSLGGVQKIAPTFVHGGQKLKSEFESEKSPERSEERIAMEAVAALGKVINLDENQKAKDSEAYARWIKIHNLKEQAKTFNFMSEHGLLRGRELDEEYTLLTKRFRDSRRQLKDTEDELKDVNRELRLLGQYFKGKKVYREYCTGGKQPAFRQKHRAELELFDSASRELRESFGEERLPGVKDLKERKAALQEKKKTQYAAFGEVRKQWMELGKIIQNRDSFLAKLPEQMREEMKGSDLG
jgi:hypothetical protein